MNPIPDPFRDARVSTGVLQCPFQGENVPMILGHADVRRAAKDWQTFSSDAPFRVPIPSEEDVRSMRQLPIETDPPTHTAYRDIVEPFFQRAKDPVVIGRIEELMGFANLEKAICGPQCMPNEKNAFCHHKDLFDSSPKTSFTHGLRGGFRYAV